MRLSDIMSSMGLEAYAEAGLVLFLFIFLAVVVRLTFYSSANDMIQAANIPLNDSDSREPNAKTPGLPTEGSVQ